MLSYLWRFAEAGQLQGETCQVGDVSEEEERWTGPPGKHIFPVLWRLIAPHSASSQQEQEEEEVQESRPGVVWESHEVCSNGERN